MHQQQFNETVQQDVKLRVVFLKDYNLNRKTVVALASKIYDASGVLQTVSGVQEYRVAEFRH